MTLEFIGTKEDLEISFYLIWLEAGLYIQCTNKVFDTQMQEYTISFPAMDYTKSNKIQLKYEIIMREEIYTWVDNPSKNENSLKKEIIKNAEKEMEYAIKSNLAKEVLIQSIFENVRIMM